MAQHRVFGKGPGFQSMTMAPVFGDVVLEVVIQSDGKGLMKTTVTKYPEGQPPTQVQLMGMFLDGLNGQFQAMIRASSMLVDPNGKGLAGNNGGEEKENDHGRGGDSGKPNGT